MSILSSQMLVQNFLNNHHMIQVSTDRIINMSLCAEIIYHIVDDTVLFYMVDRDYTLPITWSNLTSEPIRLMFQAEHDKYHSTSEVDNV